MFVFEFTCQKEKKIIQFCVLLQAKMSQLNISRLSNYCGYSVFSNESTESLDTSALESSLAGSPTSVRLNIRKSRSGSLATVGNGKETSEETGMTRDPSSVPNFADLQLQTIAAEESDSQVGHLIFS